MGFSYFRVTKPVSFIALKAHEPDRSSSTVSKHGTNETASPRPEAKQQPHERGVSDRRCCVRNVSDEGQNATRTWSLMDAHRGTSVRGEVIGGMRLDVFPCSSLSAAGIYFQACSFNHSDISPL
jgi:hypothetical protein